MMIFFSIILFLTLCGNLNVATVQITIKQGTLDGGVLRKSRNGTNFYSFYAIPFAKPPIGRLRFEPPQEPNSWEGVRDAKIPPPVCIQPSAMKNSPHDTNATVGKEDCLYLNVFTPYKGNYSNLLPVMFFIHGGIFRFGHPGSQDPMYFMDYPVVYVAIQYRLNALGFLSSADDILPGNIGMKDQVAALKWVQQNIMAFGGDPNRVTLIGVSSGGMCVHFHMYSPLSTGLFHRAISLGGTAFTLGAMVPAQLARDRTRALAVIFGCRELETKKLVECLRKVPAEELALSLAHFTIWDVYPMTSLAVVVEREDVPGAFLTESPWKQDVLHRVPWLLGMTANEGCFLVARALSIPNALDEFNRNFERLFPVIFFYGDWVNSTYSAFITASLRKYYLNNQDISTKTVKNLIQMYTDAEFGYATIEAVERSKGKMDVYFYLYGHRNTHSYSEDFNITENLGICHSDDGISFFNNIGRTPPVFEGKDLAVSERLVKYAVNFVYNGDPNGNNSQEKKWFPARSSDFEYLHIKTESDTMEKHSLFKRNSYMFWRKLVISFMSDGYNDSNMCTNNIVKEEL